MRVKLASVLATGRGTLLPGPRLVEHPQDIGADELLVSRIVPFANDRDAAVSRDKDAERHRLFRIVQAGNVRVLVEDHGEIDAISFAEPWHVGYRLGAIHCDADHEKPLGLAPLVERPRLG